MKKLTSIIIFLLTLGSLDAERVYGNDPPKGKVYVYKEVDGMTREMEIFFPKDHDSSKKSVPGVIMFHGGGWGSGSRVMFSYCLLYTSDAADE